MTAGTAISAATIAMSAVSSAASVYQAQPTQTQAASWFVDHYRRTEGDMSRWMLANSAFLHIPKQFRPGNDIEVTGFVIPKGEIEEIRRREGMPAGVAETVEDNGNSIFWFHPMALACPPEFTPDLILHKATLDANKAAFRHISTFFKKYRRVEGRAVASSSVRTVLLYQIGSRTLETPLELKLHLPAFIGPVNRRLTGRDIANTFAQQERGKPATVPVHHAISISQTALVPAEMNDFTVKPQSSVRYSFGFLVRDPGFEFRDGRVHFHVPFFALFGHGGKGANSLLARIYSVQKAKDPSLTPHDFVIDRLIVPYISGVLEMVNEQGVCESGLHYQNPVLKMSAPADVVTDKDHFTWADDPESDMEGVVTKEISGRRVGFRESMQTEPLEVFISNLWSYFSTDFNWSAPFPDFDRHAFRVKMASLLNEYAPPKTAPKNICNCIWDAYKCHFHNMVEGLVDREMALHNETVAMLKHSRSEYGAMFNFVRGSHLAVSALAGMEYETEAAFTLMYDKLAFLAVADPSADVHALVEHENGLQREARRKAEDAGVTKEGDPISFLGYVLFEVYSAGEIDRLKTSTQNHAGLAQFDREWLANLLFDEESGLFQRQLKAYRALGNRRKRRVDLEHLPRIGYWFKPVAAWMLKAGGEDVDGREIGAYLMASRDFRRTIRGLKTYDRGPLLEWLVGMVHARI